MAFVDDKGSDSLWYLSEYYKDTPSLFTDIRCRHREKVWERIETLTSRKEQTMIRLFNILLKDRGSEWMS